MKAINEYRFIENELEKIEKISVLEDGTVLVEYTITDEFQKEYELYYKHRILKINPISSVLPRFESYAKRVEE